MKIFVKMCLLLSLVGTHAGVHAEDHYTRLVPSGPILPPLAPIKVVSNTSARVELGTLFLELQPTLIKLGVNLELARVAKPALEEAARVGQAGVLLKTRVAVQQVGMESLYYPVGSGVGVVGHGPSPQAVLFYHGQSVFEPVVPAGMSLDATNSQYVWVTPAPGSDKGYAMETYDIDALESYTRVVRASAMSRQALEETTRAAFIEGYGRLLETTSKTESERQAVQALLQSRTQAAEQMKNLEQELSLRLERAEKAARAAAMWNTLSTVFSVGSSVALASASTGQKIQTPSGQPPKTAAELTQALQSLATETQSLAQAIKQKAEVQRQLINTLQESLLKAGANRGQPVQQGDWRLLLH